MEEFGDLERQAKLDFGFIRSQRDSIEWQMFIEELEKDEKEAKIIVNGKEIKKNDKIRTDTREISRTSK